MTPAEVVVAIREIRAVTRAAYSELGVELSAEKLNNMVEDGISRALEDYADICMRVTLGLPIRIEGDE